MIGTGTDGLTRHVDLGVLCPCVRRARQLQMYGLILGVICAGKGDRGENVKRDLSIGRGVVDRLELARDGR